VSIIPRKHGLSPGQLFHQDIELQVSIKLNYINVELKKYALNTF
jgi:hypothetical protein